MIKLHAAHTHGAGSIAVVRVFQKNEPRLSAVSPVLPVLKGHFQSNLHGGGAIVGKEETAERRMQESLQTVDQLRGRGVRDAGKEDMLQLLQLFLYSPVYLGLAMAVNITPPGRNGIIV